MDTLLKLMQSLTEEFGALAWVVLFSEARPYAEGRGIRFVVTSPSDVSTVRTLVEIKTTPK
jgi:hypothetical protein